MALSPRSFPQSLLVVVALAVFVMFASAPASAQESVREQERFMDVMSKYLEFSTRYVRIAEYPHAVLHLSVESIVETYEARGEGIKAVEHLRGLLAETKQRTARNILRMKIRDLLQQYGRSEEALAELDALFRENNNVPMSEMRQNRQQLRQP